MIYQFIGKVKVLKMFNLFEPLRRKINDWRNKPTKSNRDALETSVYVYFGRERSEVDPRPMFVAIYNSNKELVISGEVRSTPGKGERLVFPFDAHIDEYSPSFEDSLEQVKLDTYKNTVIYSPETKEFICIYPSPKKIKGVRNE